MQLFGYLKSIIGVRPMSLMPTQGILGNMQPSTVQPKGMLSAQLFHCGCPHGFCPPPTRNPKG